MSSAAEIIHQLLLNENLGGGVDDDWPIRIAFLPDLPHSSIAVYDTAGVPDGRIMQGSKIEHPGIQVTVRGQNYRETLQKAQDIATAFDNQMKVTIAVESDTSYIVHNISRQGTIVPVGIDENDGQRRHYFTINAIVTFAAET